jgi:hypothetical protein
MPYKDKHKRVLIGGGGNKHRKSIKNRNFYLWLKQNDYPSGYRVLCMNCNFAEGKFGYCPHQQVKNIKRMIIVTGAASLIIATVALWK